MLPIEPLLQRLRRVLNGLTLINCESYFVLSAYADDVVVIVKEQNDVNLLMKTLDESEMVSAAKVNWSKMVGERITVPPKLPGGLTWKKDGLKYLGVCLGDESFQLKNWEGMIEKIKVCLYKWKWIKKIFSNRGRTLIINNLVVSSLWHRLISGFPHFG